MAAGWSSLPGDLANLVGDRLLDTNDLDAYMDFRAVCHGWRASTADPRSSPHLGDPRFQPRQWLMLDEGSEAYDDDEEVHQWDAGARLFVNAATGRFVRRDLRPALRGHFVVAAAAGGALVLADRTRPHAASLLNPFTGSLTRFAAPVPAELELEVAAHVIGSSPPTLLLLRYDCAYATVYWADPISERFSFPRSTRFVVVNENGCGSRLARQALAGGIFAAGGLEGGSSASLLHPTVTKIMGLIKTPPPFIANDIWSYSTRTAWKNCFLVESAGEMLIVFILRRRRRGMNEFMEVFKMSNGSNELEPVRNIGSRAIFVGAFRSLSVDADKFASVEANCIYYARHRFLSLYRVYSLEDEMWTQLGIGGGYRTCVSAVELLCRYTSHVEKSELGLELRYRQFAAVHMELPEGDRRWRRRVHNRAMGGYPS
ncbi:unnamed protein product [Urochloa humidicola]